MQEKLQKANTLRMNVINKGIQMKTKTKMRYALSIWKIPTHSVGIHFQGKSAYVPEKQR